MVRAGHLLLRNAGTAAVSAKDGPTDQQDPGDDANIVLLGNDGDAIKMYFGYHYDHSVALTSFQLLFSIQTNHVQSRRNGFLKIMVLTQF